ncbi:2og-fe oxygenase superfamily [Fusarium agapanthi]|uniref:2og-fe oxygenase superfamily n=1 Tax=Fusarium agapanthi TaxID=1803897 RepID=A0A9P5EGP3_9HYPO|nr:2og-fe oxygenase superfamily [Fusarium agapanthi]
MVVDTTVHNTWKLDASKFNLVNENWFEEFSSRILRDTAKGLGMFELRADPHKLLLYELGSFFQTHSDSEKEQGMIGTLVVCLLSQHEGGDVCLSFGSQKRRPSIAENSEFDLTAMSWYSDVAHEVERLTSGYGLVLTYKLFATGEDELSASTFFQRTKDLKSMLAKFRTDFPTDKLLLYPLDHLYIKPSLCLRDLKGRDRSVGRYLNEICSEALFSFMLGQTTHFQVDYDSCDEYQDQTTLRTLYNLDVIGDAPPLFESSQAWANPIREEKIQYQASWKNENALFVLNTLKECSKDEEWLRQTFLQKIVPRAERSFLLFLLQRMSSERTSSIKKFPELYKFALEHAGQQLDFPIEELRSDLITGRRSQGTELVELLKDAYVNSAGQEALRILERNFNTFNENKELWLPFENYDICDEFLEPLIKVLESNEAPTIPAVQDFLEIALREVLHRPINSWPDELVGWAHKKSSCWTWSKQSAKTSNGWILSFRSMNSKNGNAQSIARNWITLGIV